MNERIRLLAEKAKGFVDLNQHVGGTRGCMVYTYDGLEKFAELIVRECADIVEQAKKSPFVSLDDAKRMSHFVDVTKKKIKQHFGVEE